MLKSIIFIILPQQTAIVWLSELNEIAFIAVNCLITPIGLPELGFKILKVSSKTPTANFCPSTLNEIDDTDANSFKV